MMQWLQNLKSLELELVWDTYSKWIVGSLVGVVVTSLTYVGIDSYLSSLYERDTAYYIKISDAINEKADEEKVLQALDKISISSLKQLANFKKAVIKSRKEGNQVYSSYEIKYAPLADLGNYLSSLEKMETSDSSNNIYKYSHAEIQAIASLAKGDVKEAITHFAKIDRSKAPADLYERVKTLQSYASMLN